MRGTPRQTSVVLDVCIDEIGGLGAIIGRMR